MYAIFADVTSTRLRPFLGEKTMIKLEVMNQGSAAHTNPVSKVQNATIFKTKRDASEALKAAKKSYFDLNNYRVEKLVDIN
jgi:hypothetical protein